MRAYSIDIEPQDGNRFKIAFDGDGVAGCSVCQSPQALAAYLEKLVEIIVDRESGGSGLL